MKTNILAVVLGVSFTITGIVAFFLPQAFFDQLPDYYGVFNLHFVKDAGLAFFSSGTLILLSIRLKKWCVPLTLGGVMFVVLHGLFHIQMLLMGMAPAIADKITEIAIVIFPSLLAALLFYLRLKEPESE